MKRLPQKALRQIQPPARVIFAQIVVVLATIFCQLIVNRKRILEYVPHQQIYSIVGNFSTMTELSPTKDIPVFYNVYVANQSEYDRVRALVTDQLSYLKEYHNPVYVHTIGYPLSIPNTTLLQHHTDASELVTLHSLWEYCTTHPSDKVVYLHSKGSYHPSVENDHMRQLLTMGALSDECANFTDNTLSNLCGYRVSPFPHPHVPGNMWLAHCSYVNNLLEPYVFHTEMDAVYEKMVFNRKTPLACTGNGRFSAEHWVHSHPSAKPSDLYTNPEYTWAHNGLREYREGDFEWKLAPRYGLNHWYPGCECTDIMHRLKEFRLVYNMTPGDEWWGWNFWLGPAKTPNSQTHASKWRRQDLLEHRKASN
jgi:hypothetical protein